MLVDDNGMWYIVHSDILECEVRSQARTRPWPRLDPDSILCIRNCAVLDFNSYHILVIYVLPQAPHAEIITTVSRD